MYALQWRPCPLALEVLVHPCRVCQASESILIPLFICNNEGDNREIDLCSTLFCGETCYHQFLSAACIKSWIYYSNFNLLFVGLELVFSHWMRERLIIELLGETCYHQFLAACVKSWIY